MAKAKKTGVKRELLLALFIIIIFVSLLITWSVVDSVEETPNNSYDAELYENEEGAKLSIKVLPESTGDDVSES